MPGKMLIATTVLGACLAGCGGPECTAGFEPDFPEGGGFGKSPVDEKVHVPVPPLESYWWLQQANIFVDPELAPLVEDYESGYPAFLKAIKRILTDRGLALSAAPTPIDEILASYHQLAGADPANPLVSTADYDEETLQASILAGWQKANPGSTLTTFQEITTAHQYLKPGELP